MNKVTKSNKNEAQSPKDIFGKVLPDGFEQIFLAIYFVCLPYIAGILFLYIYVSKGKQNIFMDLYEKSNFILTLAIGYEIVAALLLLYILKKSIDYSIANRDEIKTFRRPK